MTWSGADRVVPAKVDLEGAEGTNDEGTEANDEGAEANDGTEGTDDGAEGTEDGRAGCAAE